ncbi:unnamed protein product [Ranitomeya imitator]|uniref:Uncharacterized protein n=1 Tax=Ranitomeya imitator TaxID=111125 RepID=A0ABN9MNB4_9NEOB|nr:unnamed protein product [Ranitomeya imitator]
MHSWDRSARSGKGRSGLRKPDGQRLSLIGRGRLRPISEAWFKSRAITHDDRKRRRQGNCRLLTHQIKATGQSHKTGY